MNLNGKVAIVTGATGGIGFGVAKRLGKDGFTVILNGIEDDKGAERVEELNLMPFRHQPRGNHIDH